VKTGIQELKRGGEFSLLRFHQFLFDNLCDDGYNGAKKGRGRQTQMKRRLIFLFCVLLMLGGCTYTMRSAQGTKVSAAQIQEIKLGKTTETDLLSLLGPPSRKEVRMDGSIVLLYMYSETETPTLPGGFIMYGFLEKDREETFEILVKDGVVQSFHFTKP
jgi:hypothetical protein